MGGSLTFDKLVLSGKSQWTIISRWPDATVAQNEARKLVAATKHLGVKVSQEIYDHLKNRFKEKTLFKHLKSDKKAQRRQRRNHPRHRWPSIRTPELMNSITLMNPAILTTTITMMIATGCYQSSEFSPRWSGSKKTILFITHGIHEAVFLDRPGDRIDVQPGPYGGGHTGELSYPRKLEIKTHDDFGAYTRQIYGPLGMTRQPAAVTRQRRFRDRDTDRGQRSGRQSCGPRCSVCDSINRNRDEYKSRGLHP